MLISECVGEKVNCSTDVARMLAGLLCRENEIDREKEHLWTIGLNTKNAVKYIDLVTLGTLTGSLFHPRETFRTAIKKGCASILIAHNHPSGDTSPSKDDIAMTQRAKSAGEILGVQVLDHIILSADEQHYSMKEAGYL